MTRFKVESFKSEDESLQIFWMLTQVPLQLEGEWLRQDATSSGDKVTQG